MFCGSCGAELNPSLKFCENCGAPVAPQMQAAAQAQTVPQAQAAPQAQAVPVGQCEAPSADSPQPPYQQAVPTQPPYQQAVPTQAPSGNLAPNAAFVLTIVGLVLSCLFVTFLPGLVCSIIGLVLNSGYSKKGFNNPRKTATNVLGIIGIVIGVLCLVLCIFIGVVTAQVIDEAERQGIDITTDSVEVTTDSSGHINISVRDSSAGASKASASAASSAAASSGASSASSSSSAGANASASSAASSGGATSAKTAGVYDDAKFHDAEWNPTMYSLLELSGAEMQDLLDDYNFSWDKTINAWTASDGSQFGVYDASGLIDKDAIEVLPKGAAGQSAAFGLTVEGYATPGKALTALTGDVVTEDLYSGDDDVAFAVVYGPSMVRHLVAVTETDSNEQTFLVFTEESIANGVFESIVGVNAGSTMDEVWQAVTGGYHIGGYVAR